MLGLPNNSRSVASRPRSRRPRPAEVADGVPVPVLVPAVDDPAVDRNLETVVGVRGRVPRHLPEKWKKRFLIILNIVSIGLKSGKTKKTDFFGF